jgi:O-antigen ligase
LHSGVSGERIAPSGAIATIAKGGLVAPLFFVSLALACAGSRFGYVTLWALSVLAMLAAAWAGAVRAGTYSRITTATLVFSLWVVFHTLLVSPAYTPAGLFHPLLLLVAFGAFRRFDVLTERRAVIAALALGAILAAWGLVQIGPIGVARAHALFETPATYATVVNLLLVPLLALLLAGQRGIALSVLGIALAAALFATDSRGGFIALAAGLGTAAVLAARGGVLRRQTVLAVLGLVAAGWILVAGLRAVPFSVGMHEALPSAEAQAESSLSRLELYELSARAWLERPFAGTGYLTFRYVLERGRASVPSYGESSETWFVHNDYLQALQELGPLGLAGFLSLAWLPVLIVYRRMPTLPSADRSVALAATSALTATACHALVDFPYHVPACLLLCGALLGSLDRRIAGATAAASRPEEITSAHRAVRAACVVLAGALLLRPVFAEVSAEWGLRLFADRQSQSAAYWLEAARRVEPADWRYHWYAGQFWDDVASTTGSRDAARLANTAFAAGFEANPLEVRNLLGLISLHRRHGDRLDAPANTAARAAWVAQAEALAPFNATVRRERHLLDAVK